MIYKFVSKFVKEYWAVCLVLLVIITFSILFILIRNNEVISGIDKYYLDTYLKIIGGIGVLAIAWWRWNVLKIKSDDETYLKTIEILENPNSQASYVGASYSLKNLAKYDSGKYAKAAIIAIEASIRELSEASYYEFITKPEDKSAPTRGSLAERKRMPAIIEMLRIILELRCLHEKIKGLPPMNLGFADLRDLSGKDMCINKDAFKDANLNRADLRYVKFLAPDTPLSQANLHGAWVNIKRSDIEKELISGADNMASRAGWIKDTKARYFLTGNWSTAIQWNWNACMSDKDKKDIENKYKEMFVEGRIAGGPGVQFDGMDLTDCDFNFAFLKGASFRGATITRADFLYADLEGADFTGALGDAFFEGAITDGVIYPMNRNTAAS